MKCFFAKNHNIRMCVILIDVWKMHATIVSIGIPRHAHTKGGASILGDFSFLVAGVVKKSITHTFNTENKKMNPLQNTQAHELSIVEQEMNDIIVRHISTTSKQLLHEMTTVTARHLCAILDAIFDETSGHDETMSIVEKHLPLITDDSHRADVETVLQYTLASAAMQQGLAGPEKERSKKECTESMRTVYQTIEVVRKQAIANIQNKSVTKSTSSLGL